MIDLATVSEVGLASVQDLGRPGNAHLGIAANGAADAYSARVANTLVGNGDGAALVEITGSRLTLTIREPALLAVTGAAERLYVDDVPVASWEPMVVYPHSRLRVEVPRTGHRSYLAFNGALDAASALGSVSRDRLLDTGRQVRPGDVLRVASDFTRFDRAPFGIPFFRLGAVRPRMSDPAVIDVTVGPEAEQFTEQLGSDPAQTFEVSTHSDEIGLRLLGSTPVRSVTTEIVSRGVPIGAVEIPPTGGPIVLLRGRFVTAGYPVVAVATTVAVDRLGQLRPGSRLSFRMRAMADVAPDARRREGDLRALAQRVARAFEAAGVGHVVHGRHLSRVTAEVLR